LEKAVFEIAHRNPERKVYWHLDDQFVGSSVREHNLELSAKAGPHKITIVDEVGETLSWNFEVLEK
jgi:penicillin-binding protein 1C